VVDAGGMGFVIFLEGIINYLKTSRLEKVNIIHTHARFQKVHDEEVSIYRYCCESLLTDLQQEPKKMIEELSSLGDSIAIAGGKDKLHLHIHSNNPSEVFNQISQKANISNVKVDDMVWQHRIMENRKYKIGLITDSAADFPLEIKEKYQINTIPIKLIFGDDIYLDKVTIDSEKFFDLIEKGPYFPRSSQPDPVQVGSTFDFVSSHYDQVISISISARLSGVYNLMKQASHEKEENIVFNSRHLSVSQGLLVLRVAEAIRDDRPYSEIIEKMPEWRDGSWIFTDIQSLNYLVRGGRISPLKGKIAKILNLKPIISVDEQGKGIAWGKSFSRRGNMKKIIKLVQEKSASGRLWNYAIVHAKNPERADMYADKLEKILGKKPLYIMNISPVVGVHNGPGTCAVGLLVEKE
jgi:hypothetical protein